MKIEKLSKKQKQILKFAHSKQYKDYNALICDGAVRSGKTAVMTLSFVHWAMRYFNKSHFAICGKTIVSAERNIVEGIKNMVDITAFFSVSYLPSKKMLTVKSPTAENYFYVFGGKDKGSAALIQGLTLCGVFFDEVALQEKSFVEQAIARTLSIPNSKLWFNCNPEHPEHWFYKEWILDADGENKRKSLHIHFLMNDNPILSEKEINKANSLYSGVFKDRFIYGKWVAAEGLVYSMFGSKNVTSKTDFKGEYYISIDYGTANPFSMGLWVFTGEKAVRLKEYYYDSRKFSNQKTDEEYYKELVKFAKGYDIKQVIIDPSAASFIQTVRRYGQFKVRKANNSVLDGIRLASSYLKDGKILINSSCKDILREFSLYSWDEKQNNDTVVKEFDHALDEMRYFCTSILQFKPGFARATLSKNQPKSYIDENSFSNWGSEIRLI